MSVENFDFDDRDLQSAFDIILFTSSDVDEGKEPIKKSHRRDSSSEFIRLGSHDTITRDAFSFTNDMLAKESLEAYGLGHSSSEQSAVSWKDTPAAKKHRVSSEMTFEQWHGEQLAALEQNVFTTLSMSHDEYEQSLQHLNSTVTKVETSQPLDDNGSSSSGGEEECPRATKKRPNVREHSKAQREKRKATIKLLEEMASTYSSELSEYNRIFREVLEKYAFRRKYCYETLCNFLDMWIHGEETVEAWQVVVDQNIEMSMPYTTTRFRPPGQIVNCRRVLKGVSEIIADSISISVMCVCISSRGLVPVSKFQMHIDISATNFILEDDIAMADFNMFSKNAILCGGKYEIQVDGMLKCGFNPAGNLQWVDLCFNECDMQQQLLAAFGPDIYGSYPNIARMRVMMRQSVPDDCEAQNIHLITTLDDDLVVVDMDSLATQRIGSVVGRSLVSADWVAGAVRSLSDWAPYICQLDSPSADGQPAKILCTLYPFYDETVEGADLAALHELSLSAGISPNRVLWTMYECPAIPTEVQIATMIRLVIQRIVESAKVRVHGVDPSNCPNVLALLRQASTLFDDGEHSTNMDSTEATAVLVNLMESFLKWVESIEANIWNLHQIEMLESCNEDETVRFPSDTMVEVNIGYSVPMNTRYSSISELSPLEKVYYGDNCDDPDRGNMGSTALKNRPVRKDGVVDSRNIDMDTLADMSSSLDTFFSQLRDPSICPHIIGLLRTVPSAAAAQVVEEFNTFCQTKHTDPRMGALMRDAQNLVRSHQLEKAIETLNEIIALDSDFVEAYNRRATANYGLRRAQECYADLEQVLSRNPLHFGALCGKGLLMMNLKSYDLAAVAFETVLYINPRLQKDEAILRNLRFCNHHIHTKLLDDGADVGASSSVWTSA